MRLYLQFGHGMLGHSKELLKAWGDGGVILSPRDLNVEQLKRAAKDARDAGVEALLDPQCYARASDHPKLCKHRYFELFTDSGTGALLQGTASADILAALAELAGEMGTARHILPGIMADPVDDDWFDIQEATIAEAASHFGGEPVLATISLSSPSVLNEGQVEDVVERALEWDVDGFYVVAETPGPYLVDDPGWVANLMILAAGLAASGKKVIVGYCNHQMLCMAPTGVEGIASGTWLNVRAFGPEKFFAREEDSISRRATWYYCPSALSEYKMAFLDIAQRHGVLDELKPQPPFNDGHVAALFQGGQPSTAGLTEGQAFRHYLTCLRTQCNTLSSPVYVDALDSQHKLLDDAESVLQIVRTHGVLGQDRDFHRLIDVNRSALVTFDNALGPKLRRVWK